MQREQIEEILESELFENSNIQAYFEDRFTIFEMLSEREEVIEDFELWQEQQEIKTDKILDCNYYSTL